jgi:hypothetical protein
VRHWLSRLLIGLVAIVLLLIGVRERYAPQLTLPLRDRLGHAPGPVTAALSDDLDVRLYGTTRPYVGKIATLQKGLVLVHEGRELTEEGYGFGLPIIETNGTAYVSRHAEAELIDDDGRVSLVKAYRIDVVDRPTRFLRVKYADVAPLGTVSFTYTIRAPDAIAVTVDFRGLDAPWDRAYLMNEQGARAFDRYVAPDGETLDGTEVGIWQETQASFGCWEAPGHGVRFCVDATPGQRGFVGRERYRQYNWLGFYALSWSGIDIALEGPMDSYTYTIRVEETEG